MYFKLALFALVCSSIVYCNENDIIKRWRETNPRFMQYPSCGTNTCPSSCGNSCGTINGLQACQCQPGSSRKFHFFINTNPIKIQCLTSKSW